MAIDPKININENQVVFRRDRGHNHDGLTSSLIDFSKYSIFDFIAYQNASPGSRRRQLQDRNELSLKTFIVSAVEERVLNPQGIRIQANAITAREIVAGTIGANELSSNIVLVNNIIRSNNYVGNVSGWRISSNGNAEFNDATIRGRLTAGDIYIPSVASPSFSVTSTGVLTATSATVTGTLNSGAGSTVGPLTVQSEQVFASWDSKIVSLYTNNTWGGGGAPDNWARIGLGVKDTGSSLSLYTSRGTYIFSSDTPPFWPYDGVTSLTKGRLLVANTTGVFLTASAGNGRLDFRSGSSGITAGWGRMEATSSGLTISRTEGTTNKLVSIPQDSSLNEFINLGNPISGAGGAGWETLYWNTTFGTLGRGSSSIRYKENINDLEEVGGIIDQLRPVSFVMKPLKETTPESEIMRLADIQYGFIAEEVAEIDNGHLSIFQDINGELIPENWRIRDIVALLVKEVQNLRARVSTLESSDGNL